MTPSPDPWYIEMAERGRIPDIALRLAIRSRVHQRARSLRRGSAAELSERALDLRVRSSSGPVTEHTDAANAQHYELPSELYELVLGPHRKYSSAWWPPGVEDLASAEAAMLRLTCERARLADGQRILELGCGWGSLTLWMAESLPNATITAVSNSKSQRFHIEQQLRDRGLSNVEVVTCDVGDFEPDGTFDRVVSVEMFEHVRNHAELMRRIATWLEPDGSLFVHIFSGRYGGWVFDHTARHEWMARHFFTGGVMPSDDLLVHLQNDLVLDNHWFLGGQHYARTCDAWLGNLDRCRDAVLAVLDVGDLDADVALGRWRMFLLACSELFGYDRGRQFGVSHYLFVRRPRD